MKGFERKDIWVGWSIETVEEKGLAAARERLKDAIPARRQRATEGEVCLAWIRIWGISVFFSDRFRKSIIKISSEF